MLPAGQIQVVRVSDEGQGVVQRVVNRESRHTSCKIWRSSPWRTTARSGHMIQVLSTFYYKVGAKRNASPANRCYRARVPKSPRKLDSDVPRTMASPPQADDFGSSRCTMLQQVFVHRLSLCKAVLSVQSASLRITAHSHYRTPKR